MPLPKIIITYLLTTPIFFIIDILWLGIIAKGFYQKHLSNFLNPQVNWTAAIIFYLLFIIGIIIFSVIPGIEKNSISKTIIYGALFGFFTYATYDLSNLATLKDWPFIVVIVDILWGMIITSITATAGFFIAKWIM